MTAHQRLRNVFTALVLLLVANACSGREQNGTWWRTLDQQQQDGYVAGYFDCSVFEKLGKNYPGGSRMQWIQAISAYYRKHPNRTDVSVISVFHGLDTGNTKDDLEGLARHSYFDGEFWRQMSKASRTEFVRGYLACRRDGHISIDDNLVAEFSDRISKWYDVSDVDVAEIDEARTDTKIGDVIAILDIGEVK